MPPRRPAAPTCCSTPRLTADARSRLLLTTNNPVRAPAPACGNHPGLQCCKSHSRQGGTRFPASSTTYHLIPPHPLQARTLHVRAPSPSHDRALNPFRGDRPSGGIQIHGAAIPYAIREYTRRPPATRITKPPTLRSRADGHTKPSTHVAGPAARSGESCRSASIRAQKRMDAVERTNSRRGATTAASAYFGGTRGWDQPA